VSRYAATPLIVALSPGHSDITRFSSWSPIATGNHLYRAENISGRGALQVEKSPCLNWATKFLTVANEGACSPNVSVRMV